MVPAAQHVRAWASDGQARCGARLPRRLGHVANDRRPVGRPSSRRGPRGRGVDRPPAAQLPAPRAPGRGGDLRRGRRARRLRTVLGGVERADLVVVGGGTIGGWASYFAKADGTDRVVLLERDLVG